MLTLRRCTRQCPSTFTCLGSIKVVPGKTPKNYIPAYDEYGVAFKDCDDFNAQLVECPWPYRRGGYKVSGEAGTQHDFAMACILQNIFNVYRTIHRVEKKDYSFQKYCTNLAIGLFRYAKTADILLDNGNSSEPIISNP